MTRLIDADAIYKTLESCEIRKATIGNPLTDWEYGYTCGIERAESEIECAPTLDAEPVRHAKWEDRTDNDDHYVYCSECGDEYIENDLHLDSWVKRYFKYCPNCGARMVEDE